MDSKITALVAQLRDTADRLEALDADQPLSLYVGGISGSLQVVASFGSQAERIREVVRINRGLGIDGEYEVSSGRLFGVTSSHRIVSAYTPLDDSPAEDGPRLSGAQRLMIEAGVDAEPQGDEDELDAAMIADITPEPIAVVGDGS